MNDADRAWEFYLQGYRLHWQLNKEANIEARAMFRQATAIRPDFARGYAHLSFTLLVAWLNGWDDPKGKPDPEVTLEQVTAQADTAIGIDDKDYDNWWSVGLAHTYSSRFDQAFEVYERIISDAESQNAAPANRAALLTDRADARMFFGEPEAEMTLQAVQDANTALSLCTAPQKWFYWTLGWSCYDAAWFTSDKQEQKQYYEQALAALSRFGRPDSLVRKNLIAVNVALERFEEAQALAKQFMAANPTYTLELENRWPYRNKARLERYKGHLSVAGLAAP